MMSIRSSIFIVTALIVSLCSITMAQTNDHDSIAINGTIHTPSEIIRLMESSTRSYNLNFVEDTIDLVDSIPNQIAGTDSYLEVNDDGTMRLIPYQANDATMAALLEADSLFHAEKYDKAIVGYRKVLKLYPQFYQMYIWIAQSFEYLGTPDSAISYYNLAIDKNFIDYDAHWFLGDLQWNQNDTADAIRQLTIAHILNRHHVKLKERLIAVRKLAGRPWRDWSFRPLYRMTQSGNRIDIELSLDWMLYVFTMALWEYEPGYAEKMSGQPFDSLHFNLQAVQEAITVWTLGKRNEAEAKHEEVNPVAARILDITENKQIISMIYYELLADKWPHTMLLIPRHVIDDIISYIDDYH